MGAAEYERAIVELEALMALPSPEADYQRLFEQAPEILASMGYTVCIPQPRLPRDEGGLFVPDFLARIGNDQWEIVDLKTPAANVLRGRRRREAFTAEMNAYIGQMHDYAEWFQDKAHRDRFEVDYGAQVSARPHSLLIAGREQEVDRAELFRQLRRIDGVKITTFDDVLKGVQREHARHYGAFEHTYGFTVATAIMVSEAAGTHPTQLWRVGSAGTTNLRLTINERHQLVLSAQVPGAQDVSVVTARGALTLDVWCLVLAELAFDGAAYRLQLRIDDAVVASLTLRTTDVLLLITNDLTLGDPSLSSREVAISEIVSWHTSVPFRTRLAYTSDALRSLEGPTAVYMTIGEGRHMTSSHQNPNLTSPSPETQPMMRLS